VTLESTSALQATKSSAFADLGLRESLVRALENEGYARPTPIQAQAIPSVLDGRDVLATAQTGTGKTAAFLLPTLQRLAAEPRTGKVRALVLTPTRELAAQIGERATAYGGLTKLKHAVIFGGVGQRPQEEALAKGVDLVIATPGRLLDLIGQGHARLDGIQYFILDEADRMLDMGFIHDVRRVVKVLPTQRQTLLFSATMPKAIVDLAGAILRDPVRVAVEPKVTSAVTVEQSLYHVAKADKRGLLEQILRETRAERTIVFTRTKHGANRLTEQLQRGGVESAAIHGNKSQNARTRALEGFRSGSIPVLIATDLAARGIDVDGVTHVVNFDLPDVAEQYVHRIGRTGRAGATGVAIAFCDEDERSELTQIERLLGHPIPLASGSLPAPARGSSSAAPRPREPRHEHRSHDSRRDPRGPEPRRDTRGPESREPRRDVRAPEPRRDVRAPEPRREVRVVEARRDVRVVEARRDVRVVEPRREEPRRDVVRVVEPRREEPRDGVLATDPNRDRGWIRRRPS